MIRLIILALWGVWLTPPVLAVGVILDTSPSGLTVSVDNGNPVATPVTLDWMAGSVHTITAVGPQTLNGTRYVFASWSNGGGASHSVTVPSGGNTVIRQVNG